MSTSHSTSDLNAWQRARDIVLVVTLLGSTVWFLGLGDWLEAETHVPVGTVQSIRFFGPFGLNTQIDTTERSFVMWGVTRLKAGQAVVLHTGRFSSELCTPDRRLCEHLKGHPQ